MAVLYGIYGIKIAAVMYGVTGTISLDDNMVVVSEKNDGTGGRRIAAALGGAPTISFSSREIEALLDVTGLTGLSIASLSGGITLYFTKQDLVGRNASSVHYSLNVTAGVIVPTSISASQDQLASINYTIHAISSGSAYPGTEASNAALSAIASPTSLFTLGPAIINGTRRDGLTSWTLNLNQGVTKMRGDGSPWPKAITVDEGEPSFDIMTKDSGTLAAVIAAGALAQGGTQSDFYLREVTNNSICTAEDSLVHIRLRVTAGIYTRQSFSGSGLADLSVRLDITKSSTTAMVGYTKDLAIPS